MTSTSPRASRGPRVEIWSRAPDGTARKHGEAAGLTFEDACKHLSTESLDFWTCYERGMYRGRRLYATRQEALADDSV